MDEKDNEQQDKHNAFDNIPFKEIKADDNSGFNILLLFILMIISAILLLLSPVPAMVIKLFPKSWIIEAFDDVHQQIVLREAPTTFENAVKLKTETILPVLGTQTGLCFIFNPSAFNQDDKEINPVKLRNAIVEKPFVEIIVRDELKKEYELKEVLVNKGQDEEKRNFISICYEFGIYYSLIPEQVTDIYLKPNEKFTPQKIIWRTTKTIY